MGRYVGSLKRKYWAAEFRIYFKNRTGYFFKIGVQTKTKTLERYFLLGDEGYIETYANGVADILISREDRGL